MFNRTTLSLALVASCALMASNAGAQITLGGVGRVLDNRRSNDGINLIDSNSSAGKEFAAGSAALWAKGDWSVNFGPGSGPRSWINYTFTAWVSITIGRVPVRVSDLTFDRNAKWVNGGGTAINPTTVVNYTAGIWEEIPGNTTESWPLIIGQSSGITVTGNNLRTVDNSTTSPLSYILAAGGSYSLEIRVNTSTTLRNMKVNDPTISVTNEFGGDWSADTFRGFKVGFNWATVPTPGTLAPMALLGLVAARRRR
ncbi:MAG: hypothetical protein AABZ53_14685 [Planctomycetota bacterium]